MHVKDAIGTAQNVTL